MLVPSLIPSTQNVRPGPRHLAVIADDKAIGALIDALIEKSGMSQNEIARRLGVAYQTVQQRRRAKRPSLIWIARLAEVCGARIIIELPMSSGFSRDEKP